MNRQHNKCLKTTNPAHEYPKEDGIKAVSLRKPIITLAEIECIVAMRETAKSNKERLEILQDIIKIHEQEIIRKLDQGAYVSSCEYIVSVRETEKRFPARKQDFIDNCGKALADENLDDPEETLCRDLLIKKTATELK